MIHVFKRPVHIGLSPNISFQDVAVALKLLCVPWLWKRGSSIAEIEQWFNDYFKVSYAASFVSGRIALTAILEALELSKGDEVLIQAFTCVAVPNCVLWAGLKPVYVDVDSSLNIDMGQAESRVTTRTRALIVQHTFGIPADMERIKNFCNRHNLILIEDCAHALGATYQNKLVGTFGDAAFFSFGRDKIVSSVFGGMVITNNKNLSTKLAQYQENLPFPSYVWMLQQLLHPLITWMSLISYNMFHVGKILLWLTQRIRLISYPVSKQEFTGNQPSVLNRRYSNALAVLGLLQLKRLEIMNKRRQEIAAFYFAYIPKNKYQLPPKKSGSVYLRFNIQVPTSDMVRFQAKKRGMILGNWYSNVVDPQQVDLHKAGYETGSCPKAEKAAREALNLPTYPDVTDNQVKKIVSLLQK